MNYSLGRANKWCITSSYIKINRINGCVGGGVSLPHHVCKKQIITFLFGIIQYSIHFETPSYFFIVQIYFKVNINGVGIGMSVYTRNHVQTTSISSNNRHDTWNKSIQWTENEMKKSSLLRRSRDFLTSLLTLNLYNLIYVHQ